MKKIPVVWSNDDISFGQADKLKRQLKFIDKFGIKGSFFVIPRSVDEGEEIIQEDGKRTIDKDKKLLDVIEKAKKVGHTFHQHGYVHSAYECGIPEFEMIDFSDEVKKLFSIKRFEIEKSHTVDIIAEKLELGRKIWRKAFGEEPDGFRPGWGAYCLDYYRALELLGFKWASTRIILWTSWVWGQGKFEFKEKFREGIIPFPHKIGKIIEMPMSGDYSFKVKKEDVDKFFKLAVEEFNLCWENNYPFVLLSHWHGLERDGTDTGYEVHEKLLPYLIKSNKAEFITMPQLYEMYKNGKN